MGKNFADYAYGPEPPVPSLPNGLADATRMPTGIITPGNINLYGRPEIPNPNGGISTVYSMSFGDNNGHEILVPQAADGRILNAQQAIQRYQRTGEHLGIFDTPDHATAYAQQLHRDYESGKYTKRTK